MSREHTAEAILRDGASVLIRPLSIADRDALVALFGRMGPVSRRHRFGAAKRELTDAELDYFANPDGTRHVAIAATIKGALVGVARYVALDARVAEIAFDVADADQGRGIGTLLLEHLARIARANGFEAFRAQVESDNAQMLEVFAHSGFPVCTATDAGVCEIEFAIDDTDRFLAAATERERLAASRSVDVFFAPSSVAVVGASRKPNTIGRAIFDNLVRDGYRGALYPINPAAREIGGRPCFPSIAAVGAPVDLAVIAVPARDVEGVVRECAAAGVRGVVVISSGFAEIGDGDGERRLRELVRGAGMRMVGPNCMGVLSTDPSVRLDATFSPCFPPAGGVSLASQSGALGLMMLDRALALELGVAKFVSLGNKADVSVNDLLAYWHDDPRTRVIALYLESFGNPRTFVRLAPAVARRRPVVAVKSGRSVAGTRAATSHSASLASLDAGIDALFAQTGVIRTDTLEQMFDIVTLLASQPVPAGNRIGVVTNAGGPGILVADACEARGLVLPALAGDTVAALRARLPAAASVGNPVDMTASAPPEDFEATIGLVGRDPNVDAVVAIYVPPMVTAPADVAAAIARGAAQVPAEKPVATVWMSSQGAPAALAEGPRGQLPSYSFPENAALALAAAVRYGRWRAQPVGEHLVATHEQEQAIRALIAKCDAGWQPLDRIAQLLAIAGVDLAELRLVAPTPQAACAAAEELGFPVVLKAVAPGLVHKSDRGGVALGLADAGAVARAATAMLDKIDATQLVVQRQLPRGVEAIVGVTTDPTLGPLVLAGIGGTTVELYKDVAFRVPPLTDRDAAAMLDELRGKKLLDGYRGAPAVDRTALIEVVRRVAALVEVAPEIAELDLNPVIVLERGAIAADARIRIAR